jgi:hypothetical protein
MKERRGADSKMLLEEIKKIIERYTTKLTVRQIYYQLVSKHLIQNVVSQYQRVSKILVAARHDGEIDWDNIEDRTRQESGGDDEELSPQEHYKRWDEAFRNSWKYFKLPMWKNQPNYVEIWFEKQALEGIFKEVTQKYNVVQLACKGYSSHTMGYRLLQRVGFLDGERQKNIWIFYFGDQDPSGLDIYRFIQDMCERFGLSINFRRVAITKEQIERYNIPPMMAKASDSRYEKFVAEYGEDVVELDALDPNVLMELIESSIQSKFNRDTYDDVLKMQGEMREKIKEMLEED